MKRIIYLALALALVGSIATNLSAQTPTDALMMDRHQLCNALIYGNSRWSEYWEGALRRSNDNIGTNINQHAMFMANFGITKRLNVMAGLPYVWTKNTQGHLSGQRGIQDLGLWVKYRAIDRNLGPGQFSLMGTLGGATPASNYSPDVLPMAIGMGCSQASLRAIADYHLGMGAYLTVQGGYILRSNSTLDRDAYQFDGKIYYTNKVPMPNMYDYSVNLGYRMGLWNVALNYSQLACTSGDDIRRNDGPFVANNMDMSAVGLMVKFHAKHVGAFVNANQVFAGRNVGRSTGFQAGLLYALYVSKQAETK